MNNRLISTSLAVGAFFGLDKVAALGRQVIVARSFGLSPDFDAFNVANNLPDTLVALLSGGAVALAFIPVLTETLEREGRAGSWDLFSRIVNLAFVVAAVSAALMALFPLPLVSLVLAPGFSPAQQRLTAELMRLNLAAMLMFSVSGLVMSGLQSHQQFVLPALAPILYNVGQVAGVTLLKPLFGIRGLAYGVIFGAALHLAIQVPGLMRYGFKWTPALTLAHEGVRRVLRLMGPRLLTIGCINLVFLFNDRLASGFGSGAISALYYGWNIMQLPETVIGTAAGTVLLPTLSALAARGERAELQRLLRRALMILGLAAAPAALAGLILVRPAVQLVFEGRAFTAEDSAFVVLAARMFLLGLVGHSLKEVTARAFYAHQDARTPLYLAALTLGLFIAFGRTLTPALGFAGLALANSLAFTAEALLMVLILRRRGIL